MRSPVLVGTLLMHAKSSGMAWLCQVAVLSTGSSLDARSDREGSTTAMESLQAQLSFAADWWEGAASPFRNQAARTQTAAWD
jgi:hypothetical protein